MKPDWMQLLALFSHKRTAKFRRDTSGTATVEAVLWLPMFMVIFALMTDAAMIFNGHSRVMRVVQDANRNLSIGRLDTELETENYILTTLTSLTPNATVETLIVAGVVTSTVNVPARDLQILGLFTALRNLNISITSQHLIEF